MVMYATLPASKVRDDARVACVRVYPAQRAYD
jgi:hypothetical protein